MREDAATGYASPTPPWPDPRDVATAAVLVTIGFSLLVTVGEWFATFDACTANPACTLGVSGTTLDGYIALLVLGIALSVGGVTLAFLAVRRVPRRALILWL